MFKELNNDKRLQDFRDVCTGDMIYTCYKNKLEFNCTYNNDIEQKIYETLNKIEDTNWIDLID